MIKQIKSNWYYVFWGIATVSVVVGQVYVGSGYREVKNEIKIVRESITEFIDNSRSITLEYIH
jgi:hypothetical protein